MGFKALVAYDYIITVGDEWELFWKQKWTGSSYLFMINRYLTVLTAVWSTAPFSSQVSLLLSSTLFCAQGVCSGK